MRAVCSLSGISLGHGHPLKRVPIVFAGALAAAKKDAAQAQMPGDNSFLVPDENRDA